MASSGRVTRWWTGWVALALIVSGCGGTAAEKPAQDTLTRRQRDSAIGAMPLPGTSGVRGALKASDSATARNARLDSLGP